MDYRLEQWINGQAGTNAVLDASTKWIAGWGEDAFIGIVVVWFLIGWIRGSARDRQGAITALIGAGAALLANQIIIQVWTRPRPFVAHPDTVNVLLSHSADPSFPSDHASPAFAIALVLVAFHRKLGALALLLAILISYSRVYVGDHYPGDVAAGAVVGAVVAFVLLTWLDSTMIALGRLTDRVMTILHLPMRSQTGERRIQ